MAKRKKSAIDPITMQMGCTTKLMPSTEYVISDEDIIARVAEIADANAKDFDGRTMLMFAALNERAAVAEYLLSRGADINCGDANGFTALHFAVQANSLLMVELLLKNGAHANAKDAFGNTPLMRCNNASPISIFKALLERGANPAEKNNYNMSAADMFCSRDDILALF